MSCGLLMVAVDIHTFCMEVVVNHKYLTITIIENTPFQFSTGAIFVRQQVTILCLLPMHLSVIS